MTVDKLIRKIYKPALAIGVAASMFACSEDWNNELNNGRSSHQGMLTVSITDSVIDDAAEVWVQFDGIELKPAEGSSINIDFDSPVSINLLNLQGSLSQDFFHDAVVDSGTYNWMRLKVSAVNDGTLDSYIKLNDGTDHELDIPSGAQTGLKINTPFEVNADAQNSYTVDFDLRKSIVLASGEYKLKPVIRLIETAASNSYSGSINPDLATAASCTDSDPITDNAIYLFAGHDVTPDDIDGNSPDPVNTALLTLNTETGMLDYELGFLEPGNYTIAFTCQAGLDLPESDETIVFELVENITVDPPLADISSADTNR